MNDLVEEVKQRGRKRATRRFAKGARKQGVASLLGQYAIQSNRIDRIGEDVDLIERRLDLVEAP
jgi:hypothetical protein